MTQFVYDNNHNPLGGSFGTSYIREIPLEIRPATGTEVDEAALRMAEASYPWSKVQPFKGNPDACRGLLRMDKAELLVVASEETGEPLMSCVFRRAGFLGRPAIRFPVLHHDIADDKDRFVQCIRKAVQYATEKTGESVYVTLPTGDHSVMFDAFFNRVSRELGLGKEPLSQIGRVPNYLVKGQDEIIFKRDLGAPRDAVSIFTYPNGSLNRRAEITVDTINVHNPLELLRDDAGLELLGRLATEMSATNPWQYYGYTVKECIDKLCVVGAELLVACSEGQPVGFLLFDPTGFLDLPEIGYICVFKACRGNGVGTRLIEGAKERLKDLDLGNRLFLTVSEPNDKAIRLYQRLGFEDIGRDRNYNVTNESELMRMLVLGQKIQLPGWFSRLGQN